MSMTNEQIKQQVKERYGALAEQFAGSGEADMLDVLTGAAGETEGCCGPSGCCDHVDVNRGDLWGAALYQDSTVGALPDSVTGISLGCGDPTTIANLRPGQTVLDLGSGGGIDCFLAAKNVGPTGHVIGVDMTDSMLELANQNRDKLGLTNVEFRKGEIENLPVESNSVDVIISNCVINLSPDKDAVIREAFRVLKPGGRFAVSDMVTEGDFPERLRQNMAAWSGCISGALDQSDFLDKLQQAGFVDVAVESRSSYGLESLDTLDEASRQMLSEGVDWDTVPDNVRLYSAKVVARKP